MLALAYAMNMVQMSRMSNRGYQLAYNDAPCTVLAKMVLAIVVPARLLASSLAPQRWQRVGLAVDDGSAARNPNRRSESPTSALIQASAEDKATPGKGSARGLSADEVYGNIFIFDCAGQDTPANTMAHAITLLAIHPENP